MSSDGGCRQWLMTILFKKGSRTMMHGGRDEKRDQKGNRVDRNNAKKKIMGSSVIVQTIECLLIQSHVKFFFFFFSRLVSAAVSAWRHCLLGKWGFYKGRDQKTPELASLCYRSAHFSIGLALCRRIRFVHLFKRCYCWWWGGVFGIRNDEKWDELH